MSSELLELVHTAAPHLARRSRDRDTDSIPDRDDYVELDDATATLRERLADRFDELWADGREPDEAAAQELARQQR